MEEQPQPSGAIFVIFLWLTMLMLSLLVAVLCNTFDALTTKVNERLMFRRAKFCVTIEKLFPIWYHQHRHWGKNGCDIGSKLGVTSIESENDTVLTPGDVLTASERTGLSRFFADYGAGRSTPRRDRSCSTMITKNLDRWLLWSKNESTFEKWRKPMDDNDLAKHV